MSEVRALLLTDVVDSTKLSEALGDAEMSLLWAAHDRGARDLLSIWRGREIDKTDGMLLLFDAAADAVAYAMAYQRSVAKLNPPLEARAGLHVGPVVLRENSAPDVARGAKPLEVEGLAKPTAARVMSLARGGQTLLTAEARDALGATALRVQSHGHWRVKGIAEPIELFEVGEADALFLPPPDTTKVYRVARKGAVWLPVRQIDNNLPQQVTTFVGRERELSILLQRLSQTRLLTLLGIGGLGKTRLSLQVATAVMGDFPDGVWFVELAPLSDPGLVPQTVATILCVKEEPGKPVAQALTEQLKYKRLLLLLDNCEHLLDACAKVADGILRQCPGVQILASSREALGIGGEQAYPVPSLSLPDPKQSHTPASVAQFEAVQLFTDRALLARADFQVTNQNASTLASICYRLDGIPLAIELAAARVRSLSVEEISRKLDQRFRLLTGGSRTALPRHQTLRSLIDWSYDLLHEPEKLLLQRLSAFAGGWPLAAAEQVCAGEGVEDREVFDLLTSLVDKSLVIAEQKDGHSRYRMLETVRQYVREKLLGSGAGDAIRELHRNYFLALAEEAEPKLLGAEQAEWLQRLEQEHDNLRSALEWSLMEAGPGGGLRLCGALARFWWSVGYLSEGRAWCARVLGKPGAGEPTTERAKALSVAGTLGYYQADYPASRARHEESLAIQRQLGDRKGMATSLNSLGNVAFDHQGDFASCRTLYAESLAIVRELGDQIGIARSLHNLGNLACEQGDFTAARALTEESLAILRELGDRGHVALSLHNLGNVARQQGDFTSARTLCEESLAIRRKLGDRWGIGMSLNDLGELAMEQGDFPAARALLQEGLAMRLDIGDKRGIAESLDGVAAVVAALGSFNRVALIWGAATRLREEIGSPLRPNDRPRYERSVAAARAALGDDAAFDRAWQEGRTLTLEHAIQLAMEGSGQRT